MHCPSCKSENPSDSVYCGKCATPLPLAPGQDSFTKTLETPTSEPTRGTVFAGRYEIIEELGIGGMGRVYRAHDTKLNEEVALKLIKPEFAAEKKIVERFRNEIKVTRKITHKNVCRMHDLHEEGKTIFLTMEYVRGEDLKSLIHRTKALTVGSAVSYAHQIADGLAEAHKLGVTHRDLKPGNIMIDKEGQAKVMDFGIARVRQEKGMTGEGAVIGTPEYMSPEQVEGKPADPRSDIYALGVILFEMVVGCPPFEGETPFSIANKHKTEPPPVPKKLLPELPEALNKIILRCLEKDKGKRYQTAEELVADLSAVEQALPLTERALTRARTKTRTSRDITVKLSPRKLIIPAVSIIVLTVAIVLALTLLKPHPGAIDSIAVLPLDDLSTDKSVGYSVDGIHESLINELYKVRSLKKVIDRRSVLRYRDTTKSILEIARDLKVAAIIQVSVVQTGPRIRLTVTLFDGRNEKRIWGPRQFDRDNTDILALYREVALTIAREINAQLTTRDIENLSRSRKVDPEAYRAYLEANSMMEAQSDEVGDGANPYQKIIELYQRSVRIDPAFALGYAALANFYGFMAVNGVLPRDDAFMKSKDLAMKALSLDDSLGEAHAALGTIKFGAEWDFSGAEKEFQRAMELGVQGSRASYVSLTNYLVLVGRFDEAIAILNRAIESNPLAPDYASLSWALCGARRYHEAIAAAKKCIELNVNVAYARWLLMDFYSVKGMCAEAIAEVNKFTAENPLALSDSTSVIAMAVAYERCGDRKKAGEMVELMKRSSNFNELNSLVPLYALRGEKDLAFAALEKMCEKRDPGVLWLKVDPTFDPLRDDPRFKALLKIVGFEK